MSIRTRITVALGAVLLFHVVTAVMGHVGLERSRHDSQSSEQMNADTIRVLGIDRTIAELQRNVSAFLLSAHASAADRVRELLARAELEIDDALARTSQAAVAMDLRDMSRRIARYGENFEKVATDRAARGRLVHEEMAPIREAILDALHEHGRPINSAAAEINSHVLRADTAAMRYFDTPRRDFVDAALGHLAAARGGARPEVDVMIDAYEAAFLDAVQATRGYLHLVNVVLAGEAAELLQQSQGIRARSLAERDELRAATEAAAVRFQRVSDTIAILTVIAGILAASWMTRSVLRPVLRMTDTLRRLARDEHDGVIEGAERPDEIGAMASAAEVFRQRNIETERLLAVSQQMQGDLERRNDEMTQFVYTVSHDLKSPLVTIQGFAGMLRGSLERGRMEEAPELLERISTAAQRMNGTLEDLLELSRIGVVRHAPLEIDLTETCRAIAADLASELETAGADLRIADDLPCIFADEVRMRQVLQNLIHNAIRHGRPASGPPVIRVTGEAREGVVTLRVSDNGPGIAPKHFDRIFGIFERLHASTSGTGVGLAIVKRIADAHGGRVWVESTPGRGATFCFSAPQRPGTAVWAQDATARAA